MRPLEKFIDQWGLLDKLYKPDGGDTCQREGMFFALAKMSKAEDLMLYERFDHVWEKLHPHPGVLLRHCNPEYDASDWDRMSRDQLQPVIIAFGYWDIQQLRKLAWGHLKRGFIFTNNTRQNGATKRNHGQKGYSYAWKLPDFTGPEIWANFIRAFKAWYLYPLLLVFDLELLFGSIKWRYFPRNNIAMNQTLSKLQGLDRLPTPWTWLAEKICPIEYMIDHIADHFDDFGGEAADLDMEFFEEMFRDAAREIGVFEKSKKNNKVIL